MTYYSPVRKFSSEWEYPTGTERKVATKHQVSQLTDSFVSQHVTAHTNTPGGEDSDNITLTWVSDEIPYSRTWTRGLDASGDPIEGGETWEEFTTRVQQHIVLIWQEFPPD